MKKNKENHTKKNDGNAFALGFFLKYEEESKKKIESSKANSEFDFSKAKEIHKEIVKLERKIRKIKLSETLVNLKMENKQLRKEDIELDKMSKLYFRDEMPVSLSIRIERNYKAICETNKKIENEKKSLGLTGDKGLYEALDIAKSNYDEAYSQEILKTHSLVEKFKPN